MSSIPGWITQLVVIIVVVFEHDGVPAQRTCESCYRIDASHQ